MGGTGCYLCLAAAPLLSPQPAWLTLRTEQCQPQSSGMGSSITGSAQARRSIWRALFLQDTHHLHVSGGLAKSQQCWYLRHSRQLWLCPRRARAQFLGLGTRR